MRGKRKLKKPTIREQAAKVEARHGKTLGASRGKKPAPKVSVRGRPRGNLKDGLTGFKLKVTKKF